MAGMREALAFALAFGGAAAAAAGPVPRAQVEAALPRIEAMARETHKFESHYVFRLLGSSDFSDPVWRDRSPLYHVDAVRAPLLLMQGEADEVVPPSQARTMYDALADAGRPVCLVTFPGEGHGFRKAASIQQAWADELGFYGAVWGLHTDGGAQVDVENL